MSKFILAGLVTLALAGCTGTIIGGGTPYGGYDRDTVSFIAAWGADPGPHGRPCRRSVGARHAPRRDGTFSSTRRLPAGDVRGGDRGAAS